MTKIEKALLLDSVEEILKEIELRNTLRDLMVGDLYPSIITEEIRLLNLRIWDIQHIKKEINE